MDYALARILPESIRQADGGKVVCTVATPQGQVQGTIEESFFEEFMVAPTQPLSVQRRLRIAQENLTYLEAQATYEIRLKGQQPVVIR